MIEKNTAASVHKNAGIIQSGVSVRNAQAVNPCAASAENAIFQSLLNRFISINISCFTIRFGCFHPSSVQAHTCIRFLFAFPTATTVLLRLTSRPYFSPILSGIVRQGAVTRSISRRLLYPFVSHLAVCRHLEGAVNLQFYSVLLHSIRLLILIGYQPNDKERGSIQRYEC